jgi:octaprenyl-diphosphate synthase
MNQEQALQALQRAARQGDARAFDDHMDALRSFLGGELATVEDELPRALGQSIAPLVETGRHLIQAGGKRIRPILTLLGAGATGQHGPAVRALACAGELVHVATLMHDDVIDDADVRRGHPTPRMVWSNTASVLGGDYALTRALDLVSSTGCPEPLREAIATLRALVEGEILQLQRRNVPAVSQQDYFEVIDRKTASLFRWACRSGAWLSGDEQAVDALGRYGWALGRSFQMVDDVLDFATADGQTGKAPLTDLAEGKRTLPLLLALEADPALAAWLPEVVESGKLEEHLDHILACIHATDALGRARQQAAAEAGRAMEALQGLTPGPHVDALYAIAHALARRMH